MIAGAAIDKTEQAAQRIITISMSSPIYITIS